MTDTQIHRHTDRTIILRSRQTIGLCGLEIGSRTASFEVAFILGTYLELVDKEVVAKQKELMVGTVKTKNRIQTLDEIRNSENSIN